MSKSLKGKTHLNLLLQGPVLRCRKESSPGYKAYILKSENRTKESPALNDSVIHRIADFPLQINGHYLHNILNTIIKIAGSFLILHPLLQAIIDPDTTEQNYNSNGNQYRNDNY